MTPYAEVIGSPVAHSLSPAIHRFWLEQLGLDGDYRAIEVRPAALSGYFADRRKDPAWKGCNVTAPLKGEVAAFLDALDGSASYVGAINCVFRDPETGSLIGRNSDVEGIAEALARVPLANGRVVIIGGGGAARAAIAFARQINAAEISLLVRDVARAPFGIRALDLSQASDAFRDAGLIINATPLGMLGSPATPPSLLDALAVAGEAAVFDMIYHPLETELLRRARECSLSTIDGLAMLVGQARPSFACFFGADPPREGDSELRRRLINSLVRTA